MNDFFTAFLCIISLIGLLTGLFCIGSFIQIGKKDRKAFLENMTKSHGAAQWYKSLHSSVFREFSVETVLFTLTSTQHAVRLTTFFLFFFLFIEESSISNYSWKYLIESTRFSLLFFFLFGISALISDILPRCCTIIAYATPTQRLFRISKKISLFFALLFLPVNACLYYLMKWTFPNLLRTVFGRQKKQAIELIEELEDGQAITHHDKRLISSVFSFRHRIAREIMKPRVEIFAISENMSVQEASEKMLLEGYSRVPTYQGTIDNITGILFYKDLLPKYIEQITQKSDLDEATPLTIEVKTLVKKVFYCPETKKISSLLQEFRKRQVHLAVIVDEYGGTSGVVTIEDILEEIVGEIADEYDEQESLFRPGPKGSWIVDAQMNLHDIFEEIGIEIPQGEEYDTIAGYIFFRLGTIPKSGMVLHHDHFDLKIIKSNDRMVEEILIIPLSPIQPASNQEESELE